MIYSKVETTPDYDIVSCASSMPLHDLSRAWSADHVNRWPTHLEEVSNDGKTKHVRIRSTFHCMSD